MIASIYRKLWCSSAQKFNFTPTSFLRYHKDFAKLLFRVLWACLVMSTKTIRVNLYDSLMFICMQKINFILQRYYKLAISGILRVPSYDQLKWYCQVVENLDVYLHAKNHIYQLPLFWNITKILQTCYFWYFGHA